MDEKKVYENGIHDISNNEYHASSGISRSSLLEFKRSPYHFWHKYMVERSDSADPSAALVMGNLIHTMVLEPHKFDDEFVVRPEMDRRTNAGKFAYNQFISTMAGRMSVTKDQVNQADLIANSILTNELCKEMLEGCEIEKSIYFTHLGTGIQCKVRPDAFKGGLVIDLKTTADASYRSFQNSAYKFGYFLQAAMIDYAFLSQGMKMEKFIFIVVEKEPPYAVAVYVLDEEAIVYGVKQCNSLIDSF